VLYSFPDTLGKPGIGTTAFHQVEGLLEQGVEVVVWCTSLARRLSRPVEVVETLRLAGRRVPHRLLGGRGAYAYHDRRVARRVADARGAFDVVHCWPRATLATAAAARRTGALSVREAPNTHTAYAFEAVAREYELLGLPPPRGHSHTLDERVLAREEAEYAAADALLVPSEFARVTFVERGVPDAKLHLHDYGYDPGRFYSRHDRSAARQGLTAAFVGRSEPRKGLHYALRAWLDSGAAEHGRFVVCGGFDQRYRELLAPLLAHPSVEVVGFTDDVRRLLEDADVLLLPSIEEGSALVTYEAQACGCALLVSDAAGARFEPGRHGFVHHTRDVGALTEQLAALAADPALVERVRQACLDDAPRLTWSRAGERLRAAYAEAASA
jgi:glycosyltransferase involved in cell wall biosynthesis